MKSLSDFLVKRAALCALLCATAALAQERPFPALPPRPPVPWIETPVENTDKPCAVESLGVEARIDGVFARVSTTIEIGNPNARPISASLSLPMPDGAAVCGYALEIDGAMVEGVAVPKEKARVAFETEQRRGVDPGLVEAVKGNAYRTRVYPVPAKGTRRIRVDWTCPLALGSDGKSAALSLPMPDVALSRRSVSIEVADCTVSGAPALGSFGDRRFEKAERFWRVASEEKDVRPEDDILVALPLLPERIVSVERDGDGELWFCASVETEPVEGEAPAELPSAFTVFWDASGSRAGDHAREFSLLREMAASASAPFRLVVFRNKPEGALSFGSIDDLVAALEAIDYDGGTDLASLRAAIAKTEGAVFLFTDGIDSLSGEPVDFGKDADRVTAFVSGRERDVASMRQACGGRVFDPAQGARAASSAASHFVSAVRGDGVRDVEGIGSDASRRATVVGRLETANATSVSISAGGKTLEITISPEHAKTASTLATAWAAMRIERLSPRSDDNEDELLALSRKFGMASPAASILVLESLDQWLRHDIEPPESLPKMREAWFAAKKASPSETPEAKTERHIASLATLWRQRMEWWNTDFSKPTAKDVFEKIGDAIGSAFSGRANAPAHARRMSAASEPRAVAPGSADREFGLAAAPAAAAAEDGVAANGSEDAAAPLAKAKAAPSPRSAVTVKEWSPDTPYLKALDDAWGKAQGSGSASGRTALARARESYVSSRREWALSPAFFLDCAGWFFRKGDVDFAVRVISNLAEMRIEDAALLRVMAWRLKEAKQFGAAICALRRVCRLRPEDAQSWRDLALALEESARAEFAEASGAGDSAASRGAAAENALAEALRLYRKVALTPWARHPGSVCLVALEEHNALEAWCRTNGIVAVGSESPLPESLRGVPDCDLRVSLAWDADETDVDLHVTEPSGEEAYYGHRRTSRGGDVSEDITDGYGPEQYAIRRAPKGSYRIRAHYYASHQQTVFGPATATATVFTNWGRPDQTSRTMSLRLEKAREMCEIGTVKIDAPTEKPPKF